MNVHRKPIAPWAAGVLLLCGACCQPVSAQSLIESGSSYLSDVLGSGPTSPETLQVSWSVTENMSDVYTYSYTIFNPAGDVVLNSMGGPTMTPEIVDSFNVGFDTTQPGAYVPNSITGGAFDQNNGADGLSWAFPAVNPGTSSPTLSFESLLPPSLGTANASDRNPPSPWSSVPNGQLVPVPVPEPSAAWLFALSGFLLVPFRRSSFLQFVRKS
jgi:hypothetical protein